VEKSKRTRLLSGVILAVVFGAGTVLGLGLDARLDARAPEPAAEREEGGEEADRKDRDRRERRVPMYTKVGDLSPAQDSAIAEIVEAHRDSVRSLHRELRDAYDSRYWDIVLSSRSAIRGVLTAEQAVRYDSLLAERDRRRQEREHDQGPGR
jgi:Spy/CpxP family protein refolding chaperone